MRKLSSHWIIWIILSDGQCSLEDLHLISELFATSDWRRSLKAELPASCVDRIRKAPGHPPHLKYPRYPIYKPISSRHSAPLPLQNTSDHSRPSTCIFKLSCVLAQSRLPQRPLPPTHLMSCTRSVSQARLIGKNTRELILLLSFPSASV